MNKKGDNHLWYFDLYQKELSPVYDLNTEKLRNTADQRI